ncbi:MAG: hypothetical protein KDD04_10110, partial [Sinomicrobium sp.]|nr:hypothetical protein [Sinomicrobium sp.]
IGLRALFQQKINIQSAIFFFFLLMAIEFAVLWSSDAPFVRRANIFMPAVALLAAFGWAQIRASRRRGWGIVMVLYTLGLCIVSQSNAWWDTRYEAREYLNEEQRDRRIKYGSYAYAVGMPPGITLSEEEELLVLHEAAYSRYWRSFTTPFRIPQCCGEVYHCGEQDCQKIQDIVAGKHPNYRLLKRFRTREYFPERILFKRYLGNYETFLGDVLILEKVR